MLHRFQNPSNAKAIILLDESINELGGVFGGVGKGVFIKALSFMRNMCEIPGKDFNPKHPFAFQRMTLFTNIMCLNDVLKSLSLESFYSRITDGFTFNRKYKKEVFIPFNRSPKMIITSNYVLNAPSGFSSERRRLEFEFSPHYGKHRNIVDDFGHYFFDDWNQKQWDYFTSFMLMCCQFYLRNGLIEAPSINIEKRKLISEVGIELKEFLDQAIQIKTKLHKKELYDEFIKGGYIDYKYRPTQRTFTIRLKKYCELNGIQYIETPKNTKAYIEIKRDEQLEDYTTFDQVDTNYKMVDTKNKMTRFVKELKQHFKKVDEKILAIDLETTGLDPISDEIVCIALTFKPKTGYVIILPKDKTKALQFIKPLFPFLIKKSITKVFHNAKFDLKFLWQYGIEIKGNIHDTMILDYLFQPDRKKHGLKHISKLHLNYQQITYDEMTQNKQIGDVDTKGLVKYAAEDTDLTFQLYDFLTGKINNEDIGDRI